MPTFQPDFSVYTNYTPESGVNGVVFGADAPVLEVELNELQESRKERLRHLILGVVGNSVIDSVIFINGSSLTITGGYGFSQRGSIYISTLTCELAPNSNVVLTMSERDVGPLDTIYKYGNLQETTVPNYLMDTRINLTTSRRKILEYNLFILPSHTVLNPANDILIARVGDTINNILYITNTMPGGLKETIESIIGSAITDAGVALSKSGNTLNHQNYGIAGTYAKVTTNTQGHVTGGSNPTTLSGYGIIDAAPKTHVGAGGTSQHSLGDGTTAGFSTNDFTASLKTKLDGITDGATRVTVENVLTSTSTTNALSAAQGKTLNDGKAPKTHVGAGGTGQHPLGDGTTAGFSTNDFTNTEKSKLSGIASDATKVIVENVLTSTSTTNALSAAQGKTLNDGKVDITGDTLTGTLTTRTVNIQSGYTLQHNGTTIIDTNGIVARAKYNDLAELFTRGDNDIEPGDVLAYYWATDSVHKAARCDEMIIGVCSDTYGFLLGGDENNPEKYAAVALTGRVNVKVVGKVRPGDPLVLSSVSGIAQSSLVRYYGIPIIGKALAPHDGERVDRIPMLVVMS